MEPPSSPVQLAAYGVLFLLLLPISMKLFGELWKERKKKEEDLEKQSGGVAQVVQLLAEEMRRGFGELRELLGAHQNEMGKLEVRLGAAEREVQLLRAHREEQSSQLKALFQRTEPASPSSRERRKR